MVRNTIQRSLVISAVNSLACHPTAEQVYDWVQHRQPHVSRATIYRNLGNLAEEGEIRRILVPNAPDRFDFNCSAHYHILCKNCGRFEDVHLQYAFSADTAVSAETDWECTGHDIIFEGLCSECIKQRQKEKDNIK